MSDVAVSKSWSVGFIRAVAARNKDAMDRAMGSWQYTHREVLLTLLREVATRRFTKFSVDVAEILTAEQALNLLVELTKRENTRLGTYLAVTQYQRTA